MYYTSNVYSTKTSSTSSSNSSRIRVSFNNIVNNVKRWENSCITTKRQTKPKGNYFESEYIYQAGS